ncbi:ABC transporter permease [Marinibactrum halimedae]|uniref:FtsX-like permease family protein n=1 Tax=Marinibactrum halimedae TaxID=1444977 RepID=A0AA37WLZ5_9GAMM|nr:ABC transporter permease [Marinibactrum halimedae]MCD9458493.1 ABC transporter permease [Marinibactrum halimedae]GLS26644.1 hypothetical protein GCM10007877_23600 [Marinibactrum halimedae]
MKHSSYQLKQAWAGLSVRKGFLVTVVSTLGITLGALLCILTLAYVVIVKPLPYSNQNNLYQLNANLFNDKKEMMAASFTYPSLIHLYENQSVFQQSALVHYGEGVISSLPTQPRVKSTFVTPDWFKLVDSKIEMGRLFEESENKETFNPVAILTYSTWKNTFGADSNILDKTILISGTNFRVVGVLSQSFIEPELNGVGIKTDIFLPWDYNPTNEQVRNSWGQIDQNRRFVGMLDTDLSNNQIEQSLTPLVSDKWQENVAGVEFFSGWYIEMELLPFKKAILGDSQNSVLLLLAGMIGLVLIACANITNLFMSRTAEQHRQLAIQAAVGANKSHLFYTLLAQSGLLVFLSIIVALFVANAGFWVLQHYLEQRMPRVDELAINAVTLGAALLIALLLGLFFARLSTSLVNYRALNSVLQSSGKGTGIQVSQNVRKLLVVSQVAIVTVLIFVNLGLARDSLKIINTPMGFETENITSLTVSFGASGEFSEEEIAAMLAELKSKFKDLPQVDSVSQSLAPFGFLGMYAQTIQATQERMVVETRPVDNAYFSMLNQPLIEGDFFTQSDVQDRNLLLIVNDVYADKIAPQGSALGSKIEMGNSEYTISGVVKGIQMPAAADIPMRAYPVSRVTRTWFMLKLKPQQRLSREQVVSVLEEVNGRIDLMELGSLDNQKVQLLFTQYTTAITSVVLAVLTFFMASIGLFGVVNYTTQMRRFELGTRLAIGAKRADLIGLIVKDNAGAVGIGVIVSVLILLGLSIGFSESLSSYITLQLIPLFVSTLMLIGIIVLYACYWPLRPIINAPPIYSLRNSE